MIMTPLVSIGILLSSVLAQHERVSLDEKVRCSDLVVIGTVTSVRDETRVYDAVDLATSAKRVAVVRVDRVLKGQARGELIDVGFESEFERESNGAIHALGISPDGKYLTSGGNDGWCKVWEVESTKVDLSLVEPGSVNSIAYSPDGKTLAIGYQVGYQDGGVALRDARTGILLERFSWGRPVMRVSFDPLGRRLVISEPGYLRVQELSGSNDRAVTLGESWSSPVTAVTPNGRELITVDGHVAHWDIETLQKKSVWEETGEFAMALSTSPSGRLMSYASKREHAESIRIRSLTDKDDAGITIEEPNEQPMYYGQRVSAFSPDERWLATGGGKDYAIRIWDVTDGKLVHTCMHHADIPTGILWTPDGKRVISASRDGTIRTWNVDEQREERPFRPRSLLVEGEQFLLFLRKTAAPYYACVNWSHGALELAGAEVEHPEWPAENVASLFRHNSEFLPIDSNYEVIYRQRIKLDAATGMVERAISLAERQRHVCDIMVGDEPVQVLWERDLFDDRLIVRYMNRLACEPLNFAVSSVNGALSGAPARELPGSVREAADSVDPLGGTIDLGYVISRDASTTENDQLILSRMGSKAVFARKDGKLIESSFKTSRTRCPICKSRQSMRISYGHPGGYWLMDACARSRSDLYRWGGCMVSENDRFCETCGVEWSTSNPCAETGKVD